MQGHIKKRGDRYYVVIYEGLDPVTGKERRAWHPAGTDRADAERLAKKLAAPSTSTTPPSPCSKAGAPTRMQGSPQWAFPTRRGGCSPTATVSRFTLTLSTSRSSGPCATLGCQPCDSTIMRHTFAVRVLTGWYQAGEDIEARLPALSMYLGHRDPRSTYWYLSAAPELLEELVVTGVPGSIDELNGRAQLWVDQRVHARMHRSTGVTPAERFAAERELLKALPARRLASFTCGQRGAAWCCWWLLACLRVPMTAP